jgi:hypothetical protein
MYLASGGKCTRCGTPLLPGWHGDHITPWSTGGPTDVINGQALCPDCNLRKGPSVAKGPRVWQQRATEAFYANTRKDFLVSATPGAGKTRYALNLANSLISQGLVDRVVVVVPTDALRQQWADEADAASMGLFPRSRVGERATGTARTGTSGCVVTYQQLLGNWRRLSASARRLRRQDASAILDEVHHAGDNKLLGRSSPARRGARRVHRLCSDGHALAARLHSRPIPFVHYDQNGTVKSSTTPTSTATAVADERLPAGSSSTPTTVRPGGSTRRADAGVSRAANRRRRGQRRIHGEARARTWPEADVSAALDAVYEPKHAVDAFHAGARLTRCSTEASRGRIPDAAGLVDLPSGSGTRDGYATTSWTS